MRYENDVCAGCGKKFAEGDDIVVCPECGTPQHRACYEKNSQCVNAHLHESGFMWKGNENAPKKEERKSEENGGESLVCPTCGHVNPPGAPYCENCGQKFTFFGVNILEKELELAKKDEDAARSADSAQEENREEYPREAAESDIDRMMDARARIVAPGLTKQQEQERLCGHPIKSVLVFVSSNASQYANKFRKIEAGGRTWNWAAFFFTPYWFFYRKLYKPGIIFLSLHIALSVAMVPFSLRANELAQSFVSVAQNNPDITAAQFDAAMQGILSSVVPIYLLLAAMLLLSVISALIADKLYKKYVAEKLSFAETITEPVAFSQYFLRFGAVNYFLTMIAAFVGYMLPNIIAQLLE